MLCQRLGESCRQAGNTCSAVRVRVVRDASYVRSCGREICLRRRGVSRIRVLLLLLLLLLLLCPAGAPFIFCPFFLFCTCFHLLKHFSRKKLSVFLLTDTFSHCFTFSNFSCFTLTCFRFLLFPCVVSLLAHFMMCAFVHSCISDFVFAISRKDNRIFFEKRISLFLTHFHIVLHFCNFFIFHLQ